MDKLFYVPAVLVLKTDEGSADSVAKNLLDKLVGLEPQHLDGYTLVPSLKASPAVPKDLATGMNTPSFNQREMESAVEIAFTAGHYGFRTQNSRDMMASFIDWAVEFEKTPYADDDWMELIDSFATEMLVIAVERGEATCAENHQALPSIDTPANLGVWREMRSCSWVYLPKHGDRILTKRDFLNLCNGDVVRAYELYRMCEWQHPATIIDEAGGLEELFKAA